MSLTYPRLELNYDDTGNIDENISNTPDLFSFNIFFKRNAPRAISSYIMREYSFYTT